MAIFTSKQKHRSHKVDVPHHDQSSLISQIVGSLLDRQKPERRLLRLANDDLLAETVHGFFLVVPAWNVDVGIGIVRDGVIEPWTNDVFVSLLQQGSRVVNVGANFGYYTMLAAKHVGRTGRVYSIEANPVVYCYLVKGMFWAGFPDVVKPYNCAAVNPEMNGKTLDFYFDPQFIGGGNLFNSNINRTEVSECLWSSKNVEHMVDENRCFSPKGIFSKIQTQGRTLDSIVDEPIDAMIIDAEGSESFVIGGAKETIRRSPKISMIVEWDPYSYQRDTTRREPINAMWDFLLDEQQMVVDRICHEGYRGLGSYPTLTPLNRESIFNVPHSDLLIRRSR